MKQQVFGNDPSGEVWFARSLFPLSAPHGYLFVADLSSKVSLSIEDLHGLDIQLEYYAFETNTTSVVHKFSRSSPLMLSACGLLDFSLWTIVPDSGYGDFILQGEINKWVGLSHARYEKVFHADGGSIEAVVKGDPGEVITLGFINRKTLTQHLVSCVVTASGSVIVSSSGICK